MNGIIPHIGTTDLTNDLDILADLLADKRSPNTRDAYEKDLKDFFVTMTGQPPNPALVAHFLQLDRFSAIALVLKYKQRLVEKNLKEATINRRLAAIKALVRYAVKIGKCAISLSDIKSEKVTPYRDTTGISPDAFKKMLAVPDRDTLKGKRDYAILRLLWDNALRRSEVAQANILDLDEYAKTLNILGKGKGTQKQAISLSNAAVLALQDWLVARGELNKKQPLFVALDPSSYGKRLSTTSIYKIVQATATAAGITKTISPHRIRHSSVTAALDATNGDVRRVQKLSRHANLNTLMIYDDNRLNHQGEITDLLADLV